MPLRIFSNINELTKKPPHATTKPPPEGRVSGNEINDLHRLSTGAATKLLYLALENTPYSNYLITTLYHSIQYQLSILYIKGVDKCCKVLFLNAKSEPPQWRHVAACGGIGFSHVVSV